MASILIIEDEKYQIDLLSTILRSAGHSIIDRAEDGREGYIIYQVRQTEIDLVTLDIHMPEMMGDEVFKKIRQLNPKVKVVLISSLATEEMIKKCAKLGAKFFIVKPFEKEKVIEVIKKALKSN